MSFDDNGLTHKQKAFVEAYISNGFNGRHAALAAKYSKNCPDAMASDTLKIPKVKAYMQQRMQEIADKLGINPEFVIGLLKDGAVKSNKYIETETIGIGGSKTKQFNNEPAQTALKYISEINKVLDLYPKEKVEDKSENISMEKGDEILDKCRKEY